MHLGIHSKIKKAFFDTSLFRKVYVLTLFFEMFAFLNIAAVCVKCIVLSWGALILIKNFLINKKAFKIKHVEFLWIFILIGIITSFWNMSKGLPESLLFVYHSMICFFVFYGAYIQDSHEKIEKEFVFLMKSFILISTLAASFSILILVCKAQVNIGTYYLGIFRNRLIGVYTNPNLLAFSMIVSIISCDIITDKFINEKYKIGRYPKWVFLLCMIVNFVALFLSDSNASFVFIIIYFTFKMFYKNFPLYSYITIKQFLRQGTSLILCCIVMIAGSLILRNASQDAISLIVNDMHKIREVVVDDIPNPPPNEPPVNVYIPDIAEISIGRENYDISSGRFTLFKQGLKLFSISPIIGIGRGNLVLYGDRYLDGGLAFSELHNAYLTILVCYGLCGFVVFLIFGILVAMNLTRHLIKSSHMPNSGVFNKLFSTLVSYCAYSLFEKAMLSEITFMVIFFWLVLGYAMSCKVEWESGKVQQNLA